MDNCYQALAPAAVGDGLVLALVIARCPDTGTTFMPFVAKRVHEVGDFAARLALVGGRRESETKSNEPEDWDAAMRRELSEEIFGAPVAYKLKTLGVTCGGYSKPYPVHIYLVLVEAPRRDFKEYNWADEEPITFVGPGEVRLEIMNDQHLTWLWQVAPALHDELFGETPALKVHA